MTKPKTGEASEPRQSSAEKPDEPNGVGFDDVLRRMLDTAPKPQDRTPKPGNTIAERKARRDAWLKRPPV